MDGGRGVKTAKVDQSLPNYLPCKVGTAIEDELSLTSGRESKHFTVMAMETSLTGNVALLFV